MVIVNHLTGDPEEVGTRRKFKKIKNQRPKAKGRTHILGINKMPSGANLTENLTHEKNRH